MKDSKKGFEILNNYGYKVVATCTSIIIRDKKFIYISLSILILSFLLFFLLPYLIFEPSFIFMSGSAVVSFFVFMSINGYFMQSFNKVVFFEGKIVITKIKNLIIRSNVVSYNDIFDFEFNRIENKKNQVNIDILKNNKTRVRLISLNNYENNDDDILRNLTDEIIKFKTDIPLAC